MSPKEKQYAASPFTEHSSHGLFWYHALTKVFIHCEELKWKTIQEYQRVYSPEVIMNDTA